MSAPPGSAARFGVDPPVRAAPAANSTGCAMRWNQGAGVQRAIQSKGPVPLDDWTRWWAWVLGADSAGNSNGDVPMLEFTQHSDKPTLRLLLHDDA